MDQVEDLIAKIARILVEHPEQVTIKQIDTGSLVVFQLKVAKSDIGKIIGKHGRTADAIRTILNALAGKIHKRMMLEFLE